MFDQKWSNCSRSEDKEFNILESEINSELANVHIWLSANKLSLNIEKSNVVIFHTAQNEFPKRLYYLQIINHLLKKIALDTLEFI